MPGTPTALVGREAELRRITGLLEGLPDRGAALLVRGDAGVGKSALVSGALDTATAAEMTVLTTTGVPSEAQLAFAGLQHLLAPLLPRIACLPDPQAQALSAAVGLQGASTPDLFLIALATLNLLADAAAEAPVLVVAEDAHWLDADTCEVLAFAARRVELEPIVLVVTVRSGHPTPLDDARLPELRVEALDADDAAELLDVNAPGLPPGAATPAALRRRGESAGPHRASAGRGGARPPTLIRACPGPAQRHARAHVLRAGVDRFRRRRGPCCSSRRSTRAAPWPRR